MSVPRFGCTTMHSESTILVFFLLISPGVSNSDWKVDFDSNKCVPQNSSVDISCSYTYPHGYTPLKSIWFENNTPKDFSDANRIDRLTYLGDKRHNCTLRITDVRDSDAGSYKFRFETDKSDGKWTSQSTFTLSVTALLVEMNPPTVKEGQSVTLTCRSSCPDDSNPSYIWYHNTRPVNSQPAIGGNTLTLSSVSLANSGRYSCALRGHEDHPSPSVCVNCWSVTYPDQSICAVKGSSVDLGCSYSYLNDVQVTEAFWHRPDSKEDLGTKPEYANRVKYLGNKESDCTLRIEDLHESDAGEYRFRFLTTDPIVQFSASPGVTISVATLEVNMSPTTVTEGQQVVLTCRSSCPDDSNPSYIWYHNTRPVTQQPSISHNTLTLSSVSLANSGRYSCALRGHEDHPLTLICVNCWSVTYTHQSICAVKGSLVDLGCSYSYLNDVQVTEAFWHRPDSEKDLGTKPEYENRVRYLGNKESDCTQRIEDLRFSDAGEYRFRFLTTDPIIQFSASPGVTISVPTLRVEMSPTTAIEGQSVTLTCRPSCDPGSGITFIWYKPVTSQPIISGNTLTLSSVSKTDAGSYSCALKGLENHPSPSACVLNCWSVTYTHQSVCAAKGSSVELGCSYSYPNYVNVTETFWHKPDDRLDLSTKPKYANRTKYLGNKDNGCPLRIEDLQESDTGEYQFRCLTTKPGGRMSGMPGVIMSVSTLEVNTSPTTVTEGQQVVLTCRSSCPDDSNPSYVWYHNRLLVNSQPALTNNTLTLSSVSLANSGRYSCALRGHEDHPSPLICVNCWSVTYTHQSICAVKGSSVDLGCSYSYLNDVQVTEAFWHRPDSEEDLSTKPEYANRVKYLGNKESDCTQRIEDLRFSDAGEYRFRFLTTDPIVQFSASPGVTISVPTLRVEMSPTTATEGQSVTLTCRPSCDPGSDITFIWYKPVTSQPIISGNTLTLTSVSKTDAGSYSCALKGLENHPSPSACVLNCWSVTYTYQSVCAAKGSSVDLGCSYSYPNDVNVTETFWHEPDDLMDLSTKPEYANRTKYLGNKESNCALRIEDLQESDTGEYQFRCLTTKSGGRMSGMPGVIMSVSTLEVNMSPTTVKEGQSVTLTCRSSCPDDSNPSYIWYHNTRPVTQQPSISHNTLTLNSVSLANSGRYSCALREHDDYPSPLVCVNCWSVTYTHQTICAVKGSSVDLGCSYSYLNDVQVTEAFWHRPDSEEDLGTKADYTNRVKYLGNKESDCTQRIEDLRFSDAGEYRFRFLTTDPIVRFSASPGVTISVPTLRVEMSPTTATEGQSVTLTCRPSCDPGSDITFIWYKPVISQPIISGNTLTLSSVSKTDAGSYSCALKGLENHPSPSACVLNCWSVTYTYQIVCAAKGSSVDLGCSYSYPNDVNVTETFWHEPDDLMDLSTKPKYANRTKYLGNKESNCALRIEDLQESDTGEYQFRCLTTKSGGRMSGMPGVIMSVSTLEVNMSPTTVTEGQQVVLTCRSSCPDDSNPSYIWYHNKLPVNSQPALTKNTLTLSSVSKANSGRYSCALREHDDYPSPLLCVNCWSVTYTHQSICAVKGSSVDLSCSYSYLNDVQVTEAFWHRPDSEEDLSTKPEYANRVKYLGNKESDCTLRIEGLRESDAGEYRFRFLTTDLIVQFSASPGVTISVPTLRVEMSPTATEGQSVTLTCRPSCDPGSDITFIWYKPVTSQPIISGNTLTLSSVSKTDAGSYSCALKGLENHPSPSACVINCWSVTYTPQSVCGLKASSVDLGCSYSYPNNVNVTDTFWHKPDDRLDLGTKPGYENRTKYLGDKESNCALRIEHLQESDAGEYQFRFLTNDPSGKFSGVPGVTVSISTLQVEMSHTTVTEGESVTLTCRPSCDIGGNPAFIWYRNRQHIANQLKTFTINPVRITDSGRYSCAVQGNENYQSPAETLVVQYSPKNTSVSISPPGNIVEGDSVTLTCSSDANPPVHTYTWYKINSNDTVVGSGQNYGLNITTRAIGSGQTYNFNKINPEDSGQYRCRGTNIIGYSVSLSLKVTVLYSPRNTSASVSPPGNIVEGDSVTLTCSSDANPPVHNYTWYKIGTGETTVGTARHYNVSEIRPEDNGHYYCRVENSIGSSNSTILHVNVSYSPRNTLVSIIPTGHIDEGNSVTLTCTSDANPPVHTYTWYNVNRKKPIGSGQNYIINHIRAGDSGQYYCRVENSIGSSNSALSHVNVFYSPRYTSASIFPFGNIKEGDSVTLTCSSHANPPISNYTWYKINRTEMIGSGKNYGIINVHPEDSGEYYCRVENTVGYSKSLSLHVNVLYPPKNILVSVSPTGNIAEGDSVTLTCSSDGANPPAITYTWYKTNGSGTAPIGFGQAHGIIKTTREDTGQYYCRGTNSVGFNDSTALSIDVFYSPRNTSALISPPGNIVEGDSVTLTCSSDANPPVVNYTWYKINSSDTAIGSGQNYDIIKITTEDTGQYCCRGTNIMGYSDSLSLNVTVLYSPRNTSASVSPPGNIVEGDSVTLTCSSDANPPVHTYTWYKTNSNDTVVGSGQNYDIINITTEDSGQYYCRPDNSVGFHHSTLMSVDVLYPPKTTSLVLSPRSSEEHSVTLACNSDANPSVHTYTWYKKTESGPVLQDTGNTSSLVLGTGDEGFYYCVARNQYGSHYSPDVEVTFPVPAGLYAAVGILLLVAVMVGMVLVFVYRRRRQPSTCNTSQNVYDTQGDCSPIYDDLHMTELS
ncbi:sialoadhesin-like, partial [Engraulis encrasicolus]|uniref:sialoadhesin-like n=1 Tax=Engraulis encrasicolus TaxID=184585 RepID=UPI002FD28E64